MHDTVGVYSAQEPRLLCGIVDCFLIAAVTADLQARLLDQSYILLFSPYIGRQQRVCARHRSIRAEMNDIKLRVTV